MSLLFPGCVVGQKGFYPVSLLQAADKGFKTKVNNLSPTVKMMMLLGDFVKVRNAHYILKYAFIKCLLVFFYLSLD